MSTTIDQKVVEMRFDNKQFESATRESMSTLDKLKQSLNLTGASKGLESINEAAKNNNMSVLGSAVETVHAKFSALEVMGMTALANITNSAVNAGKRLAAAFTIDPIKTGFNEYELKMGSVQTIMSATGESLETVNKYLNELNTYSDKTIYSFSDMTQNIGKFTNAGVKLEDAVLAIKGISNEAAVSGANAQQASHAMYNFAQALSTGYVQLLDWKSINNASMDTVEFKNQLIQTAVALGTLTDNLDGTYSTLTGKTMNATLNWNDTLKEQWLTTDVLIKTLGNYADETTDIGKKAFAAAQDVKTFSMMMDTLKEAAQSGWATTWELIFGDFEQGKTLWTSLSNFFGNIIDKTSDARNAFLNNALTKSFRELVDNVKNVVKPIKNSADSVKEVVNSVKDYADIVNEIIGGKWGNGQERWDKLTEAGYDWAHAQNLVNEKLENGVRHATNYSEAQKKVSTTQGEVAKSQEKMTKSTANYIVELTKKSDAELRDLEYTEDEIKAFRDLAEAADKTGIPLKEFIENIDEIDGRYLLLNSFKNIGQSLVTVFKSIGQAWKEVFPPVTSDQLFNIIAALHKFSTHLVVGDKTAENLTKTLKGLFAALDIILTLTAGPLKIAFKIFTQLLGAFDMDVLDFTAMIGDSLVKFRDWIDSVVDFSAAFEVIAPYIEKAANAIRTWIDNNVDLAACFEKIESFISNATKSIKEWIDGLKETDDVPKYIIDSLTKGFDKLKVFIGEKLSEIGEKMLDGIIEWSLLDWASVPSDIIAGFNKGFLWGILSVIKNIRTFCTKIITTVKDLFGIHSPSRVLYDIAVNVVEGFINGVKAMIDAAVNAIKKLFTRVKDTASDNGLNKIFDTVISGVKNFGSKIADVFGEIDFGKIFAGALSVGMLLVAKKALDVLEMFGKPLEGLGDMLSGIGEAFEGFGKNLKASAMLKRAKALLLISAAIAVLVTAILPLTELKKDQLIKAGASLVVLSLVIAALMFALDKLGSKDITVNANLLLMAGSLFVLAYTMKMLTQMISNSEGQDINASITLLRDMILGLAGILVIFGVFVNADKSANMDKAGIMIFKMAAALLTIASVVKIVSGFTYSDITKGLKFIAGVGVLFMAIIAISKLAGEWGDYAGTMLLRMSIAMLIMAAVVKIVSGFSQAEINKGLKFIAGVELIFLAAVAVSKLSGQFAGKAGAMIFGMSLAMLAMVGVVKLISKMSERDIIKGLAFVIAMKVLFAAIVKVSHFAGENAAQAGAMLLSMSLALAVLVGITYIVSKLDAKEMWKALGFVAAVEALFAGLIFVTKYAQATGRMTTILILFLIAIGLMVAAIAGLSFIDSNKLTLATAALSSVMGMFAIMVASIKHIKGLKDVWKTLLALVGITAVLALIIAGLSKLNPDSALKSAEALSLLLLAFSSSIWILSKTKSVYKTAINAIYDMIVVVEALAIVLSIMSFIPQTSIPSLIASSVALGILLNAFASSMAILSKGGGKVNKTVADALYDMIVVVGALAIVLSIMSFLPQTNIPSLIASSIALGILLNAFAESMVILSKADTLAPGIEEAAIKMGKVVAILALILAGMSFLPQSNIPSLIASSIALGILLNALSASMVILSKAGYVSNDAIIGAALMGLVVGELAIVLGIMSALNVEASISSAIALGILVNALAVSLVILQFVGPQVLPAVVAALGMGLVLMEIAKAMVMLSAIDPQSVIPYAISLTILLTALTVVAGVLGIIAPLIAVAIPAVIGLGVVIAELAALLAIMGGLAQIPGLQWLISEGGNFLQTIGTAIGQFIGGILGGIAAGAASALPLIAMSLSAFMIAIQPFLTGAQTIKADVLIGIGYLSAAILLLAAADLITGIATLGGLGLVALGLTLSNFIKAAKPFIDAIQNIDPSAVEAAKTIAEMILVLTAAELIQGITAFIGGTTDFSAFGTQLVEFGKAVCEFSNTIRDNGGIDEAGVESAARAGKMIAGLQNALYGAGGLKQDIFGEKDLTTFGIQLVNFGSAICTFSNVIKNNGGIDEAGVESAVKAGEMITGLQSALYGAGGLKQDIFGEKDLTKFGIQLVNFGSAICTFSNVIKNNGGIDEEAVSSAANAGKVMVALQKEIVAAGGLKQDIFGEKDLSVFGNQIKLFGEAMVDFSKTVAGNIDDDAVSAASKAGMVMSEVQKAIPEDKWLDGKISIDDFGKKIVKFGEGLVDYADKVSDIDNEAVSKSLTAAQKLASIARSIVDLDTSGINSFKDVKSIGSTMKSYSDKVSDINSESISSSITNTKNLVSLIKSMAGIDISGVSSFETAISSLSSIDTSGITNAFKNVSKFTSLGANIVNAIKNGIISKQDGLSATGINLANMLVNGIKSRSSSIIASMTTLMNNMLTTISSKREAFNSAGAMLMVKMASGMSSKSTSVKKAASSSASQAASGIRDYYDSFYSAGSYLVSGFVNGISENSYKAVAQSAAMASAAYEAAKSTLAINSPSKLFRSLGYSVPEGFAMGIDRMSNMVKSSSVSMADNAINTVKKSISHIADTVNTDIDSQPVIRPVLDLSDVESGAGAISGLFNNRQSVGVLANVGGISTMMNRKLQNGSNDELVSAINKLRGDLSNIGNNYYTVEGVTYSDGSEVSEAVSLLTRAIRMEGRV